MYFQSDLAHRTCTVEETKITVASLLFEIFFYYYSGVLQGSILDPLLFLIYINNLPSACSLRIRLFADDANLTFFGKSTALLEQKMNEELLKVNDWMKANKLFLNYKKTEYLLVVANKLKSQSSRLNKKIGNNTVTQVKQTKYLGVIIDEDLIWAPHIQNQCTKIARGNWALASISKYVNLSTSKCAYYGLVYPHLQYCASIWGQAPKSTLKPIQILQNRAVRIISKTYYRQSLLSLYFCLKFLRFDDIVQLQIAKLMHSIHYKILPEFYFNFTKVKNTHQHSTRFATSSNYNQIRCRTEKAKRTLAFIGPRVWHEIPSDVKSVSPGGFKTKCKNTVLQKYNELNLNSNVLGWGRALTKL